MRDITMMGKDVQTTGKAVETADIIADRKLLSGALSRFSFYTYYDKILRE